MEIAVCHITVRNQHLLLHIPSGMGDWRMGEWKHENDNGV